MVVTPRLQRQHVDIVESCKELLPYLNDLENSYNPALQQQIVAQINSLLGKLFAHLSLEDRVLYPHAIDSDNPALSQKAQHFMKEVDFIKDLFVNYRDSFLLKSQLENPKLFVRRTRELLYALKDRIRQEEKELYPLFFEQEAAIKL